MKKTAADRFGIRGGFVCPSVFALCFAGEAHADRAFRAGADAVAAADAFDGVDILRRLDAHAAGRRAFPAADALFAVALHPEERIVARGFQEHRNGAEVFAERPVVPVLQ